MRVLHSQAHTQIHVRMCCWTEDQSRLFAQVSQSFVIASKSGSCHSEKLGVRETFERGRFWAAYGVWRMLCGVGRIACGVGHVVYTVGRVAFVIMAFGVWRSAAMRLCFYAHSTQLEKQGRIHNSISRVRMGWGSMAAGQGQ